MGQQSTDYFVQADASGKFSLSPNNWTNQYFIAVADAAGNVSPISTITEKEWSTAGTDYFVAKAQAIPYFGAY